MTKRGRFSLALLLILTEVLVSCKSRPPVQAPVPLEPSRPVAVQPDEAPAESAEDGFSDQIQSLTETGILSSMLRAIDLIRDSGLSASEFGRVMTSVNASLIRRIYPDTASLLPPLAPAADLPQNRPYTRILRDIERNSYTPPAAGSADYLEYTLPFLALYNETRQERLLAALPDLEKARSLRRDSVLAPYFSGIVFERAGRLKEAEAAYTEAYRISPECYPAALGRVRLMRVSGRKKEALDLLSALIIRYPDNTDIKRQLAVAWYENGDWSRAESAVAEVLQQNSRDMDFILMRAHILVEQGRYAQAQASLDQYGTGNSNNRLYLFLRARLQAEGYRNRDSALNYLRSILRVSPGDEEALVYAARLLMESPRSADGAEGRELLGRLLKSPDPSPTVLSLGLRDAIERENWKEAQDFVNRLLATRRSDEDLSDAYTVEMGLGNKARALGYTRELYRRDSSKDENAAAYISALIDNGSREEAGKMIETRLAALQGGQAKSRYYYLRSRLRSGEEAALGDLRSALFEDPRNLSAIIAMFEIYRRRKDERRAVYYLKQALAIAPDNARLKRYEKEYAGQL